MLGLHDLMAGRQYLVQCVSNSCPQARSHIQRLRCSRCLSPGLPSGQGPAVPTPFSTILRARPVQLLQGAPAASSLLQWRTSAANSSSGEAGGAHGSAAEPVGTPGVGLLEVETQPAAALPVRAAAGNGRASFAAADTGSGAPVGEQAAGGADADAASGGEGEEDSGGRAAEQGGAGQTYTEVLVRWFLSKKAELQQLLSVPAGRAPGRESDARTLGSRTDTVEFRKGVQEILSTNENDNELEAGDTTASTSASARTSTATAGKQQSMSEDASTPPEHPAAAALRAGGHAELSFGFSAGGLLFPYYIGVVERLTELGVMTGETKVGGASAGSLIAAVYHSGLPLQTVIDACFVLCEDCRVGGTRSRLRSVLQTFLEDLLPHDIHERCNGKVHVAVTTLFPRPRGVVVSEFTSKADLISALLTSCHIPWWFDGSVWTTFRGRASYDGGLTNFIPCPPALHSVGVCCFPSKQITSVYDIQISPDSFESWPHPINQMVSWAFQPAEEEILRMYIDKGRADAQAWAEATGVLRVISERKGGSVVEQSEVSDSKVWKASKLEMEPIA